MGPDNGALPPNPLANLAPLAQPLPREQRATDGTNGVYRWKTLNSVTARYTVHMSLYKLLLARNLGPIELAKKREDLPTTAEPYFLGTTILEYTLLMQLLKSLWTIQ